MIPSDIAYYGINLNQSVVLARIGYAKGSTPWETLYNTAIGNIIVQAAVRRLFLNTTCNQRIFLWSSQGYLPGFYVGIFLPDRLGRVRQQLYTCGLVCILYAIWAGISSPSAHTSTGGLMAIFAISQFLLTAGPNSTTFLIPAEVFPTCVRGTAHGISAAAGKCGAILNGICVWIGWRCYWTIGCSCPVLRGHAVKYPCNFVDSWVERTYPRRNREWRFV